MAIWTSIEDKILVEFYPNTLKDSLMAKFPGRTWKSISWRAINIFKLKRNKEIVQEESQKTNMAKLGVKYPSQSPLVRKKIEEKVQNKYGVSNVFQSEEIKNQIAETNIKKFGFKNPSQSSEIREKSRQTCQKKYGVDNPFQLVDKVQEGMIKKFGYKSPLQVPEIKDAQQATNIRLYGFKTPALNDKIRKKTEKTNIKIYGVKYPLQSDNIQQKIIRSNLMKYGVDNPLKSGVFQDKARASMYMYGTQKCSKQQFYIASLLNGSINYPIGNYNVDMLLDNNIICEYNGGGHYVHPLNKEKEIQREKFIKSKGYSIITIISKKDHLPEDAVILKMIEEAKNYFKSSHSWIIYDIDQGMTRCSQYEKNYNYGILKEIPDYNSKNKEKLLKKIKQTTLSRYGIECFLLLKEIRDKGIKIIKKNKIFNKSKEETKFLEFLRTIDPKTVHQIEHPIIHHIIDFYMPKYDLWVQYDGVYWHGKIKRLNATRQRFKIEKTIKRDEYQNKNIPNLIRFWSDDVKSAINSYTITEFIQNKINEKLIALVPKTFSEDTWTEEIKNFIFNLRLKYLKPNKYIVKELKEKFNLNIKVGTLQFWFNRFKCYSRTKQEWLNEYISKELIEELLNKSYRIVDISAYIKKEFNVYISDDLIYNYIQKLGLLSFKLKRLKDINDNSQKFSKEWLSQKIEGHSGLRGLSKEMGFSKTIVMKRINEEGLNLIKHRKIWSNKLETLRNHLLNSSYLYIPPEDFHQMMLGWLIGDGHLDFNGRFVINHSLHQLGYLYLKIRVLKKFITNIVTIPQNESDKYYGGREQMNISCPGFKNYIKYLNDDGSKNYEKIIAELNPIGWACYFMDDGSLWNNITVMAINDKFLDFFKNKYNFGEKIDTGLLEVKNIDMNYMIPSFSYKFKIIEEIFGSYWKLKIPELFNPEINCDFDLSLINNYTIEKDSLLIDKAIKFYRKRGFPYFSISDDYLKKEYNKILNLKASYFWKDPHSLKYIASGNNILKHFMPHMIETKYKEASPIDIFNNDKQFYKTIEYTLKKYKSILPVFIYDNLINFNGKINNFTCASAKAITEKFTAEGDIIVDPYARWGSCLIGATSLLNRNYIGFESENKTYKSLNNIIEFFKIKSSYIINSDFVIEKAPKSCNLIFTSLTNVNYGELNINDLKKLIINIIQYAEIALAPKGHLVLNIPICLKSIISTNLKEENSIFWFTATRKKNIKKAEIIYVWSK